MIHTVLALEALQQEIAGHPYTVGLLISLLFAAFIGITKLFLALFEKRVNEKFAAAEQHNKRQDRRLDDIERDIRRYDQHVAVGAGESREIHAAMGRVEEALGAHVAKEEGTTWAKIDSLVEAVTGMKLDNERAHSSLVAGQTVLETRVSAIEKKMPNGELSRLADAFAKLAEQSGASRRKMK